MALPAGLGERWMGCRDREQAVPGIRERGAQEVGEVVWVSLILRGDGLRPPETNACFGKIVPYYVTGLVFSMHTFIQSF